MNFSERLKQLRRERNVTQRQVGEAINSHERAVRNYEIGARKPEYDALIALADYFDISLDYLTGRTDDNTPMSHVSEFARTFSERLGELIPTFDMADLETGHINSTELVAIATMKKKITFDKACSIADELGVSLDYLVGRTDDNS